MMTDTRQGRKAIMNLLHRFGFWFLLLTWTLGCLGFSPSRAQQTPDPKGLDEGNYNIKQSVEFGYRFTSIDGDQQTYDTFVNLQQGLASAGFHH